MLELKFRADLQRLIDERLPESLTLDYKASPALNKNNDGRTELVKDVTAFANSVGGQIIYGIVEDKRTWLPTSIVEGVNRTQITPEWIADIITGNASPRVQNLSITGIPIDQNDDTLVAYVLSIPQATTYAPHQNTLDHKYYRRYERRSIPMYDYEIRDILRRATTPELWLLFHFDQGSYAIITYKDNVGLSEPLHLFTAIGNKSPQPATYAVITLLIDQKFKLTHTGGLNHLGTVQLVRGHELNGFSKNWAPPILPIFSEEIFSLLPLVFQIVIQEILKTAIFILGTKSKPPAFQLASFFMWFNIRRTRCGFSVKLIHDWGHCRTLPGLFRWQLTKSSIARPFVPRPRSRTNGMIGPRQFFRFNALEKNQNPCYACLKVRNERPPSGGLAAWRPGQNSYLESS